MAYLWIISVSVKILLFPAYKSTDFYVHRHWKAVTRNLPVSQWYYDDKHVNTVHTLDYPPGFALAEYILANNPLTNYWLPIVNDEDSRYCLTLKNDTIAYATTSTHCVAYMRSTVIVSDAVWWWSAYSIATSTALSSSETMTLFGLLTFHPALLWLDNVHFQYNGMLLGTLLLSVSFLMQANNCQIARVKSKVPSTLSTTHFYHLTAAALFAFLLTLKHLYLTNSLWYAVYLFRRYCYITTMSNTSKETVTTKVPLPKRVFSWQRFLALVAVCGIAAAAPCLIFVSALLREPQDKNTALLTSFWSELTAWKQHVTSRLFPFARGLVHSYWAGNVWAIYTAATKVVKVLANKMRSEGLLHFVSSVSITPGFTALCILIAQLPSLRLAWKAATEQSNILLLQSFTMTSLATFLFQYHAHEKAILTALFPCTVWAFATAAELSSPVQQPQQQQQRLSDRKFTESNADSARTASAAWILMWKFTALSLLGLFPLLYQPQELLLKLFGSTAYMAVLMHLCPRNKCNNTRHGLWLFVSLVVTTVAQLEILAPLGFFRRYEFAPLAVTSLVCATGFLWLFVRLCFFA